MIFYESWYEAVKDLPDTERLAAYDAIVAYGCDGTMPDNLQGITKTVFTLAKPLIDANAERKANGMKGGRPRKDGNPTRRAANKFINFTPSDTNWNDAAFAIMAAQK